MQALIPPGPLVPLRAVPAMMVFLGAHPDRAAMISAALRESVPERRPVPEIDACSRLPDRAAGRLRLVDSTQLSQRNQPIDEDGCLVGSAHPELPLTDMFGPLVARCVLR